MSKFSEQLHKVTEDIKLSSSEQSALRERVLSYMEHKPLRIKPQVTPEPFLNIFSFSYVRYAAPVVLVAVIFVSGGVSYAAEGAVPGDVLYPVKIHVNEEVATALIFNDEEKLTWNMRRAERRLEEASALAADGALSEETQSDLAAQFEVHAKEVALDVKAIEESNPALALEINSQFEASLMAHGEVIQQVSFGDEDVRAEAGKFLARVEAKRIELSDTLAFADTPAFNVSADTGVETMSLKMTETSVSGGADAPQSEAFGTMAFQEVSIAEDVPQTQTLRQQLGTDVIGGADEKYKEAARRMDKLVSVKIEGVQTLFKRYEDVLSKDQHAGVAELIANVEMHADSAHERYEKGEYAEAFRKFRAVLLTVLRLELYLRALGELDLSEVTLPVLPLGFPEFNQPLYKSDADVDSQGTVEVRGEVGVPHDGSSEPKTDIAPQSESDPQNGTSFDLEVQIDNLLLN